MLMKADFLGTQVFRLVLGDNPFTGHSYIPEIYNGEEMINYYTADKCVEALFSAEKNGIDTFVALGQTFILRVINQYRNQGGKMNIVFQSYPPMALKTNLRLMKECDPIGIYHQGSTADYMCETGQVDLLRERIQLIKDTGIPAGLGTHVPETVFQAEEEDWGADFYMTCLYNARKTQRGEQSGFITGKAKHLVFYPEDRFEMFKVIKRINKPCIAFKVFGGGQIFYDKKQEEIPGVIKKAFKETYENIKENDLVCVGAFQKYKNQIKENVDIVKEVLIK